MRAREKGKRRLSKDEIRTLKNLFCVLLDDQGISREGKSAHFEVKIAGKKWESLEEAENAVHVLANHFLVEEYTKLKKRESTGSEPKKNTEEENIEAIEILSGNPLKWIDKQQSSRIVDEEVNRRIITLSKSTYICDEPTSERIISDSAGGKTLLVTTILECFPEEDIYLKSRITPAWLDRTSDNLKHKILVIQQMPGYMSAQDSLHVMLTEHKLILATVGKDGEAYSKEVEGPISFGFTTTSVFINPQMETRTLLLNIDESPEQTAKIQKHQQEEEKQPWLRRERFERLRNVRKVIRWLRDDGIKEVAIPFSDLLTFPTKQTTLRRRRRQIIELIKQAARFNQLKRYVIEREAVKYIAAGAEDAKYVLENFGTIFQTSLEGISEKDWNVLKKIEAFADAKVDLVADEVVKNPCFTAKEASTFYGKTPATTRRWLNTMEAKGYVELKEHGGGKGKMNKYQVTLPKKHANPFVTVSHGITPDICKKKLREFVKQYHDTVSVYSPYSVALKGRKKLFPKEGA